MTHGASMEEMFDATLVANEPKPLVDQEPCDGAGRHAYPPLPAHRARRKCLSESRLSACRGRICATIGTKSDESQGNCATKVPTFQPGSSSSSSSSSSSKSSSSSSS